MSTWTLEEQKAHRRLWIEALRSGKYAQGKTVLRGDGDTYCCLGVLCDVAGATWALEGDNGDLWVPNETNNGSTAPSFARDFVGLRDDCGAFFDGEALTSMNDRGCSFSEIADAIESEPLGLFIEATP